MSKDRINDIKLLKYHTGYGIAICHRTYEECGGNYDAALGVLLEKKRQEDEEQRRLAKEAHSVAEEERKHFKQAKKKPFWNPAKIILTFLFLALATWGIVIIARHINDETPWRMLLGMIPCVLGIACLPFVLFPEWTDKHFSGSASEKPHTNSGNKSSSIGVLGLIFFPFAIVRQIAKRGERFYAFRDVKYRKRK